MQVLVLLHVKIGLYIAAILLFGKDWENFKFKGSVGEVNCLKREKTPDPPGLEPGTLLVMSNALTTELWPGTRLNLEGADKFFTPKAAHNTCHTC